VEPGTASGYHAVTQGYLEGEIVRRITGQTIGEFAAKEITGPLGADFHIGTPPMPISPSERACFWGGWGGSIIVIDLDQRMTYSYVMNRMGEGTTGDLRGAMPLLATYMALAAG